MSVGVVVEQLEFAVPGRSILRGVDLDIAPREVLAIMGISGGGKTSLLKCLAGLQRPTGGTIRVGEVDITALDESRLNDQRRKMGMVFQYAALFDSLTVFENVVFGLRYHGVKSESRLRETARERLAAVGLEGTEELFPAQLSGGMRKRVGLARALAVDPEVVFYDEPTSGLDPVVARVIDDLIVSVRDRLGVTSVIVSHDVPSILRCTDRIAMLHDGRIIEVGTPAEIQASQDPVVRQFIEGRADGPIQIVG
ncbi:MAG: transporter related protein [Armatimonadetes bacterium]|jgi:phospholipid/cholesterol/gamma-HCH transport system ATP-binding protein|nr:transporter related protein [Armatimonadota bacterium]